MNKKSRNKNAELNIIKSKKIYFQRKKYLILKNSSKKFLKIKIYSIVLLLLVLLFFSNKSINHSLISTQKNNKNFSIFNNNIIILKDTNNNSGKLNTTLNNLERISFTDKELKNVTNTYNISKKILPNKNISENITRIISELNNISDLTKYKEKSNKSNEKHIYTPKQIPRNLSFTFKDYQDYYQLSREGKILYKENLIPSKWPFISVIIPLYNAEKYINSTLKTVQNQRMKDIEIIIIDDCSKDKSLLYVEEAKKIDPRIIVIKNKKNMSILYSKSVGVLIAKGDYIFPLDDDDILLVDDLFEIIYEATNKSYFDIIEYKWIESNNYNLTKKSVSMKPFCVHNVGLELKQPTLRRRFNRDERGSHQLPDRFLWGKLIKSSLYIRAIEALGVIDLQKRLTAHDDTLTTFFLFKYASSFKKIGKVGLCHFYFSQSAGEESKRYSKERIYDTCLSFINYAEILYKNTENEYNAKEEAFREFKDWILSTECNSYNKTLNQTLKLAKQMLNDTFITDSHKRNIKNVFRKYLLFFNKSTEK